METGSEEEIEGGNPSFLAGCHTKLNELEEPPQLKLFMEVEEVPSSRFSSLKREWKKDEGGDKLIKQEKNFGRSKAERAMDRNNTQSASFASKKARHTSMSK